MLAPFEARSFRFQWPADLATSWAFEMEVLILGWYVLVSTGSVEQLVIFGALAWVGALFSPFFGMLGDRIGVRSLLCITRGVYAALAALVTALAATGVLVPWQVFAIAAIAGLMKPSDVALRMVLVGQTVQPGILMSALGISRTTSDTARIAGALAGTGAVVLLGLPLAYAAVTVMYVAAFLLTLGVAGSPARKAAVGARRVLADLAQAVGYVWRKPDLLGAFSVAFLVNLLAYPFFLGLLPYVAKEVYAIGQSGLGYLAGAFAAGALTGSVLVSASRVPLRAGRVMLWSTAAWFVGIALFGQTQSVGAGLGLLYAIGLVQSFCLTPLAAVMLRSSSEEMRGRVMGMRILAVWGLALGLLLVGPVIARMGFSATTLMYAILGLAATAAIAWRWRGALWHPSAPANSIAQSAGSAGS